MSANEVRAGSLAELQSAGQLLTKVGSLPVVVFWDDGTAYAIEDRCPHLGFPLHQGTVEAGLVTCHWHHARFDLVSGCTLDLWADDARGFDVEIRGDDVFVRPARARRPRRPSADAAAQRARGRHLARGREVGARAPRRGRARVGDRAHRRGVRRDATAARVGARASPCSSRWPTCSPSSSPTTRRSRSCTASRSSRATRAITRRASRSARSRRRRCRSTGSGAGTGASSTPARPTPRNARSRPRWRNRAGSATWRR